MCTMAYTPVDQLPPPPQFMLDELEREESNHLRTLFSKVLNIKEALPIRNALRQKMHVHPIVRAIQENVHLNWGNPHEIDGGASTLKPHVLSKLYFQLARKKRTNTTKHLLNYFHPILIYKSGKKKGQLNPKLVSLAEEIIVDWQSKMDASMKFKHGCAMQRNHFDRLIRCGFFHYFEDTFAHWKNKRRDYFRNMYMRPTTHINLPFHAIC